MKVAVVFWSGTGNTEAMAEAVAEGARDAVAEGARDAGAEVVTLSCSEFETSMVDTFDAFAFGCPAMGAEVLEESEFEPMFTEVENKLAGKKIALFGSYGWGDGEWMRSWEERCASDGIALAAESVTCNEAPDDDGLALCRALGAALV